MKRNIRNSLILGLSALLLIGCAGSDPGDASSSEGGSSAASSQDSGSSLTSIPGTTSSSEYGGNSSASEGASSAVTPASSSESGFVPTGDPDENLTLRMMGDLFTHQYRTVYAFYTKDNVEFGWVSSNPSLVTASPREGESNECNLLSMGGEGTVTITCYLLDDHSVYNQLEVTVQKGTAMTAEQLAPFQGGVKYSTSWEMINYASADLSKASSETEKSVTIYEEYGNNTEFNTTTDAFHHEVYDANGDIEFERTWVRGNGKVATEYINYLNEVAYEPYYNEDGDTVRFENTYYANIFGYSSYMNPADWTSIDGGKTFHFSGQLYNLSIYLYVSLLMTDYMAADDMYFDLSDPANPAFCGVMDPYNSTAGSAVKYGSNIRSVISEVGTAKVEHLTPYEHETHHDAIETARTTMAGLQNYQATVTIDAGTSSEAIYRYTYTEDTIDVKVLGALGGVISETGAHKVSDTEYYEYEVLSTGISITKKHYSTWHDGDSVKRYPTFAFASEIFQATDTANKYNCAPGAEYFVNYSSYLPGTQSYNYSLDDATLTLDGNGHFAEVFANREWMDGSLGTIKIAYSAFGSASHGLDFSTASEATRPANWKEARSSLYESFAEWGREDDVPYLYCEFGWSYFTGWHQSDPDHFYFDTEYFEYATDEENTAAINQWIADYKALLVEQGYTLTDQTDSYNNNAPFYNKGTIYISVARELNYSGTIELDKVQIYFHDSTMTYNPSSDY